MLTVWFAIMGAFINRHRGGWLPTGHTQLARLDFSVLMALIVYVATLNWIASALCAVGFFAGCLAPNGSWMGVVNWKQFLQGTLSGLENTVLPVLVLWSFGFTWWPLLVASGLKGVAYLVGNKLPSKIPGFSQGPEVGEFIFGMLLGAALINV